MKCELYNFCKAEGQPTWVDVGALRDLEKGTGFIWSCWYVGESF